MDLTLLADQSPSLFHMAEPNSWPSIRRHGLLSTSALLDLFEVGGELREKLEQQHRPECVTIKHPKIGKAVIRDQKPMSDRALTKCLNDPLTPQDWYRILNTKVFFWLSRERLERLLNARAYRDRRQTVIEIDSAHFLARYGSKAMLCPINSGSTIMNPQPRGLTTFMPVNEYPYDFWRKKRRQSDAVVELAIEGGIADVQRYVVRVTEEGAGKRPVVLFEK
jgi:hypothetical protein